MLAAACLAHAWRRECRDGFRTLTRRVRWVATAVAVGPLVVLGFSGPEAIAVAVLVATATLALRGAPGLRAVRAVNVLGWMSLFLVMPVVEASIAFTGTDPTGCL